jgi:cytochrome c oxidase subunit 2
MLIKKIKTFIMFAVMTIWGGCELSLASIPKPWQVGFQPSATPVMDGITAMHDLLLIVIFGVGIFILCLLIYVIYRFRFSVHPVPSDVAHNTLLEIIWTLGPVSILLMIGIPALKLLFFSYRIENADLTVKAIGHQWYWSYEYPDDHIRFDSMMVEDKDLKPGQPRLLEVNNRVVVPVGKAVRLIVTSEDVIHSFAVPAFGLKKDAVPGRLNETWFKTDREGVYYGQCSELCGVKHGFMPIAIEVVSQDKYEAWVKSKKPVTQTPVAQESEKKGVDGKEKDIKKNEQNKDRLK